MFDFPEGHPDVEVAGGNNDVPAGLLQFVLGDYVVVSLFGLLVLFLQRQSLNARLRANSLNSKSVLL